MKAREKHYYLDPNLGIQLLPDVSNISFTVSPFFQMMDPILKGSGMANFLFQYRDDELTAKELQKVLKPKFSPIGNNRKTSQETVMTKLLDFANCVEGKCHGTFLKSISIAVVDFNA